MERGDVIEEERSQEENQEQEFDQHGIYNGLKRRWIHPNQGHVSPQALDWGTIMKLAFQSIGVVYGDLGTSPLYVLPGVFQTGVKHNDDILGVLSLIFYSLMLITLIKYVFIVLAANDNGDGGTFALYSLICRYAKVSLTPNQQAEDIEVSNYKLDVPNRRLKRASFVKSMLEKNQITKYFILLMTMLGTSMVIGDGILTPCISVAILIILFQIQRFGTDKIGYSFAPILTIWFIFIGTVGLYNFVKHDPGVIKAVNPMYIVKYFSRNKKNAWISLGGVILCLTASFNSDKLLHNSFSSVVLAYFGQASYLRKHSQDASNAFYSSVPKPIYWPMFIVAVMAAIIASQSLISASFSIVQQSLALGCFHGLRCIHPLNTKDRFMYQRSTPSHGGLCGCHSWLQKYIADWERLWNCGGVCLYNHILLSCPCDGHDMEDKHLLDHHLCSNYRALGIPILELSTLLSLLMEVPPLLFALTLVTIMYLWSYGYRKTYMYELENKVSKGKLMEIASDPSIHRVPGLAYFTPSLSKAFLLYSPIMLPMYLFCTQFLSLFQSSVYQLAQSSKRTLFVSSAEFS
ncbi:potassium transporter 5-like [Fagus crenata]